MTTLLLDCTHGSTKEGFAKAACALAPDTCAVLPTPVPEPDAHGHHHHHHSLDEVHAAIDAAPISDAAKHHARGVYALIAAAEAKAHGVPPSEVHFHEVGAPEAIAYVVAACEALSRVSYDTVIATPICTGFGFVDCAHGRLSIPAPATANILQGMPTFAGTEEGELTTPTGAALALYFADEFLTSADEAQNLDADDVLHCNPC